MTDRSDSRVLMLASNFPPVVGGIQTYAYELASHLSQLCELELVAPRSPGFAAHDRQRELAILRLPTLGDDMALSGIGPLALFLRKNRFDVAFATHWAPGFALLAAARLAGLQLPLFVAAHGKELLHRPLQPVPPAQAVYDQIRTRVLRNATGFFPVSNRTAELLSERGVDRSRISVVHNGVDPECFAPRDARGLRETLNPNGPIVLSVARLVTRKGIDVVLRALPDVCAHFPSLLYIVVGEGPDRPRLEALARELGVASNVRFLGRVVADLADYYNACDVFVLPAREEPTDIEGFGLVFLEAAACGKVSIGARAGGVVDAIIDGVTGVLVPPDDVAALGQQLCKLLGNPERRDNMGRAARGHVLREASWAHAAAKLFGVMQAAIGRSQNGR